MTCNWLFLFPKGNVARQAAATSSLRSGDLLSQINLKVSGDAVAIVKPGKKSDVAVDDMGATVNTGDEAVIARSLVSLAQAGVHMNGATSRDGLSVGLVDRMHLGG